MVKGGVKAKLIENKEAILTKYREGVSTVKLGEEFGCNGGSVWLMLKEWGEPIRAHMNKNDQNQLIIKDLIEKGVSLYQISVDTKIPWVTVSRIAKRLGYDFSDKQRKNPTGIRTRDFSEKIVAEYQSGKSCSEIAIEFGCTEGTISKICRENGVEMRVGRY